MEGKMESVFKKLIRKEFGKKKYHAYCDTIYKNLANRKLACTKVYEDIYAHCSQKDKSAIEKMQAQLNDAMMTALRISRNFVMVFLFYAFAFLFLLGENLDSSVMLLAGGAMTAAFLVKACEFFVNKFCFIDAQIVVVYKEVLDKILKGK